MTTIQWMPTNIQLSEDGFANDIIYFEPEPAYSYYKKLSEGTEYLQCPAFTAYLRNTFVLKSPYDITFSFNKEEKTAHTDSFDQAFFDANIHVKQSGTSAPMVVSFFPRYVFISESKQPIILTMSPMLFNAKQGVVPGTFDMTKWVRPVEMAIEISNPDTPMEFKRGEGVCMVKFEPADGSVATLERGVLTQDVVKLAKACVDTKKTCPGINLKKAYEMADGYITIMKKRIFKSIE
jgi:hypothetical protein